MLVNELGVLNCVFLRVFTNLSLFFCIILSVLRNIFKGVFSSHHGWVEVLRMPEVRFARRCWLSVGGVGEDEVIVVWTGGEYVVGTVLDDWFVVPVEAVRRFLAKLLNVGEEDVSLNC
jgi:hypothetical protein